MTISFFCVAVALLSSCIEAEDPEVHMNAVSFEFKREPTLCERSITHCGSGICDYSFRPFIHTVLEEL